MPPVRFCNHTTYGHDPAELTYPRETRAATLFSSQGGPPLRRSTRRESAVRAGDAPSSLPPRPRFPHWPHTPAFADMRSRWLDACDTAESARQMPGARREGRRTKRRTRHRDVCHERGSRRLPSHGDGRRGSPPWRSPDTRVSGMALATRLGVGATRGARPDEARLPAPPREG